MKRPFAKTIPLTLLAALAFLAGRLTTAAEKPPAPPAPPLYELRIYTAAPGKMDALNARFRDHTLKFFEKHGIKSIAYWTAEDEQHKGKLYYVISYPDKDARERMLINGIAKDPGFLKAVADSEKDGKLTAATESVLLTPTDYSPMK